MLPLWLGYFDQSNLIWVILISKGFSPSDVVLFRKGPPGPIRRVGLTLNDPRSSQMIIINVTKFITIIK